MCIITGTSGVVLSPPPFVLGSLPFVFRSTSAYLSPEPILFSPPPFVVCSAGVVLRPAPVFVSQLLLFFGSFPCVLRSSRFLLGSTSVVLSATQLVVVVSVAHQFSSRVPVVAKYAGRACECGP
jgi:hypothetical protein